MAIPKKIKVVADKNNIKPVFAKTGSKGIFNQKIATANKIAICIIKIIRQVIYVPIRNVKSDVGVIKFLKYALVFLSLNTIVDDKIILASKIIKVNKVGNK